MIHTALRELDLFCAEHVCGLGKNQVFRPTENPTDAMLVLEKCVGKLKPINDCIAICEKLSGEFRVTNVNTLRDKLAIEAETLPLAICLFAKQLFGKGKV